MTEEVMTRVGIMSIFDFMTTKLTTLDADKALELEDKLLELKKEFFN